MNRENYIAKIDKIASSNIGQRAIAKKIIEAIDEKDLDDVWGYVSQRVKIGFTFDEAPEVNNQAVSVVKENEKLFIDSPNENTIEHKLIIGENYDALKNLLVTYVDSQGKGLIDIIYIDPPYNTERSQIEGNDYKDEVKANKFIYRDKFTRDGWLNMMNERLKLAKRLLSDKGVIFISIDDTEQAYLKVLCDEIFGEENFENFIWQKKGGAGNTEKIIGCLTEHILCYFKKKEPRIFNYREIERVYKFKDEKGYYNLEGIEKTNLGKQYHRRTMLFPIIDDETGKEFMPSKNMRWTEGKKSIDKLKAEKRLYFDYKKKKVKKKKYAEDYELSENVYYNLLTGLGSLSTAKDELGDILGNREEFETPKPTELIMHLLEISSKKDSIVLDFFAGSGTTGQAVMELNAEDGGTRKFILVTNNDKEKDNATKITRERLYRVINGKGSKGEKIEWEYSALLNNTVRVFGFKTESLTIADIAKAEKIKTEAEEDFKKLNEKYETKSDLDIYTQLASLKPQESEK